MKVNSFLITAMILIITTSISYSSNEKPETREEYEQKIQQQQEKIDELKTCVVNQKKQLLDLQWQIYHLKHKSDSNKVEPEKPKIILEKQTVRITRLEELCRRAGIDPNSEPNNIKKVMSEKEAKAYAKRLENYEAALRKDQKQIEKRSEARGRSTVRRSQGLGRTQRQILSNLEEYFPRVEQSTPVDGKPRRMGQTADNLACIEIIGDQQDVYSVCVMIGIPNDAPDILVRNTVIALILLENALPNWPGHVDWFNAAVERIMASPEKTSEEIRLGNAIVNLTCVKQLGMFTLSVKKK